MPPKRPPRPPTDDELRQFLWLAQHSGTGLGDGSDDLRVVPPQPPSDAPPEEGPPEEGPPRPPPVLRVVK